MNLPGFTCNHKFPLTGEHTKQTLVQPCCGILYSCENELHAETPNKGESQVHCAEGRKPNTDGTFLRIHLQKVIEQFTLI